MGRTANPNITGSISEENEFVHILPSSLIALLTKLGGETIFDPFSDPLGPMFCKNIGLLRGRKPKHISAKIVPNRLCTPNADFCTRAHRCQFLHTWIGIKSSWGAVIGIIKIGPTDWIC